MKIQWARLVLILLGASVVGSWASAAPPPFDYDKSRHLTAETRRQYDVVFFNEMETWNLNSNRYGADSSFDDRAAEFERMAAQGHFISWVALQLVDLRRGSYRNDDKARKALRELIDAAEKGDASASCALMVVPTQETLFPHERRVALASKLKPSRLAHGHPACEAYFGGMMLLGNADDVPQDRKAALPLLFDAARAGYFVAARRLFSPRLQRSLHQHFDFTDLRELDRALCWGRLAEQHTNWVGFAGFADDLRSFAVQHNRPDLIERSKRFDPRVVPITQTVVTADDCISLEQGE